MKNYTYESSHAFVNTHTVEPYQSGALDGFTFAVKDLIDIKGEITGCGNPTWSTSHPQAVAHAICVEQLLAEGAIYKGKTITDELAFSLIGENHFYGTPVNPKAPQHVPGGSSSGSASAVATHLVDFALGTDTGGSVRVPASNCGIVGYRPSHNRISLAGVMPFAPTFDTVGVLAQEIDVLEKVISILTARKHNPSAKEKKLYLLQDIFSICDPLVQAAFEPIINSLNIERTTLLEIVGSAIDDRTLLNNYTILQHSEIWNSLGPWISDIKPELGPVTHSNFLHLSAKVDRKALQQCIEFRESFSDRLNAFLSAGHLICFPTTPAVAPKLKTVGQEVDQRVCGNYYPRALAMNAISGLSRAPQITLPIALVNRVPIGLSMLSAYKEDHVLCSESKQIFNQFLK